MSKSRAPRKTPSEPRFIASTINPRTVYSTAGAALAVGTTEATIAQWKAMGLEFIPHEIIGTKQDRILGLWLLRFMASKKTRKERPSI